MVVQRGIYIVVVRGVYKLGSNCYWLGKGEGVSNTYYDWMPIEIGDEFQIGDVNVAVTDLETTPDYHLIVDGYRLTAGEYFKFRTSYLEDVDLPFIPATMDNGTCTHIRYDKVIGGAFVELYVAYRCRDCNELF